MDEDYQMIDSHLDDNLRDKILKWEYVDFSKLIPKSKGGWEEEHQRLEIINKNGVSFLSLVSERESVQITSYSKWEQAFRIYSNVVTLKYAQKGPELLQYNHTIQTAATTYTWENVHSYDHEFRHHIARHPDRSWVIILQQAWTMLLKDRNRSDSSFFSRAILMVVINRIRMTGSPVEDLIEESVPSDSLANLITVAQCQSVANLDTVLTFVD